MTDEGITSPGEAQPQSRRRDRRERRGPKPEAQRVEITLHDMGYEGRALGRADERVIFADFAIPGERAVVELYRNRPDYGQGTVVEVLEASPDRVTPPCPYFGTCGGCQWQHISYERQLELKRHVVKEQLRRIGKLPDQSVEPTVPGEPWGYRNHVRFSANGAGDVGFVRRASRNFLKVDACLIARPEINDVLSKVQGTAQGLHQVEVRVGVNTGEVLVEPNLQGLSNVEAGPEHKPSRRERGTYHDTLLGVPFQVNMASFFQSNTQQAERLAQMVLDRLALTGGETVVDAYAGVGTFAALLAPLAAQVVAIEEAPSAIVDARINTAAQPNVRHIEGKVEDVLPGLDMHPDALLLDPPRQGCHPAAINAVIAMAPPKLVYVSCDPATLARDLRLLIDGGYELLEVAPIDLFPQTYHTEVVCTLRHVSR
jgi:23S rRNA (uracil1939-C5)-methyltransferase